MKIDRRTKTDRIMDFADELASLVNESEDERAWEHLLTYVPTDSLIKALSKKVKKCVHSSFNNSYSFYLD